MPVLNFEYRYLEGIEKRLSKSKNDLPEAETNELTGKELRGVLKETGL